MKNNFVKSALPLLCAQFRKIIPERDGKRRKRQDERETVAAYISGYLKNNSITRVLTAELEGKIKEIAEYLVGKGNSVMYTVRIS